MEKKSLLFTIDYDNTCVCTDFPDYICDVPGAAETLLRIVESGHRVVLWTCRCGKHLAEAISWFKEKGINLSAVNDWTEVELNSEISLNFGPSRKVVGDYNIDDKNFGCNLNTIRTSYGKDIPVVNWDEIAKKLQDSGIIR